MLALLALACSPDPAAPAPPWPDSAWQDPGVATPPAPEDDTGGPAWPRVVINELQASNDSTVEDDHGEEEDWVELVSLEAAPVDLSGWGLADYDPAEGPPAAPAWTFPAGTTLAPGEHLLLWLDDQPEQGALHLPLKLSADGEGLALYGPQADGGPVVDQVAFPAQGADLVHGRFPDGGALWSASVVATPGNANPWDPGAGRDPTALLFPQDEVLVLELLLPPPSVEALAADPYTYAPGSVTFRGVTLQPVGIRIKGQWGSYRTLDGKSALKIDTTEFGGEAALRGLEKLTLNNMVQDPSLVHERLAYRLMREGGVPAPRTAHVALYLNGEYRGLYLHVETPDEQFLGRWFGSAEGNLYEGEYGEDVSLSGYLALEQDERGAEDPDDYSDLLALAELLALPPSEELVPALEAVLDVDEWLYALAAEVVLGHWDGYFWYPNNYRIYHDPSTGLLSLLPWGVDQTFGYEGAILSPSGDVAAWMLEVPSLAARYRLALWETADRMAALELDADAVAAHAMVLPWFAESAWEEHSVSSSRGELYDTLDFLAERPDGIVEQLSP